jgi:3-hydroxybutyryl-CoA dehydrogenase
MPAEINDVTKMFNEVGVVGAGLMGSEIALVHAIAGHHVYLVDRTAEMLSQALSRLGTLLDKGIARGFFTPQQKALALKGIEPVTDLAALNACGYITEAVFEDLQVKADLFVRLDAVCGEQCIFATNTSTIPISTLASRVSPERQRTFIGTHYFSPVTRMKLVEVIPGFKTSEETLMVTLEHCRNLGKAPIKVKDVAGFAVNRMLHAFIIEAVRLVEEGVASPEDIDTACKAGLGHPLGPFELMDAVTSSLCIQAQEIMQEAYGERFRPPALLKQRVQAGYSGGKGKPGWRTK